MSLFSPIDLGPFRLPNRIVMAPMTRSRAGAGNVPQAMNAGYYAQRATAGLIITEATQVSSQGVGYPYTPGIHTAEQVEGWRGVTQAVHLRGGRIFLQLWHVGRVSHPSLQPDGDLPVAPSAIKPSGEAYTYQGLQPFVPPRALETDEIAGVIDQFRTGAWYAREAGFDGVEIHAANGYLIDQFLRDGTNHRTDRYGGSLENRARFLLEVVGAVSGAWGPDRVGVRLSPTSSFNDMSDSDPLRAFTYAARRLNEYGLAYLHVVEPLSADIRENGRVTPHLRRVFEGPLMVNGGYDAALGHEAIARGRADLVSFGVLFLANPDMPRRFAIGAPLNPPDPSTFYGGDAHGYLDYPSVGELDEHGSLTACGCSL
ncbi:MAG: alkene reductase [candidate division NC10 bacterium]|nr:alkene reductase [candidate division NC10 bacterium]